MAKDAILFACANPIPIYPGRRKRPGPRSSPRAGPTPCNQGITLLPGHLPAPSTS
jgi:hypothetical protein